MAYPGGKNGSGVYQAIINELPPHSVYIEPFLGAGAVLRMKRPALLNIGLDLSQAALDLVADAFRPIPSGLAVSESSTAITSGAAELRLRVGCAIEYLKAYPFSGGELVYCDPPYVHSTRTVKSLYDFELSDGQHRRLIGVLRSLPCMVAVSGYRSDLYSELLSDWRCKDFQAMTRGGVATETLWLNFPETVELHDYSYLGDDYRERERIKKKTKRLVKRFAAMGRLERQALLSALQDAWPDAADIVTEIGAAASRK